METPPPRAAISPTWRLCLLAGLATAFLFLWLNMLMPQNACGFADHAIAPITHFKLARNASDITLLFGALDAPCATALAAAFDHANWPDLLAFTPLYGLSLFGFARAFFGANGQSRLYSLALGILATAWLADLVETVIQLRLTKALPGSALELHILGIAGRCNYLGLAAFALVCGGVGLMRPTLAEQATGAALCASGAAALLALMGIAPLGWLAPALALGWIAMLALAGSRVIIPHLRLGA